MNRELQITSLEYKSKKRNFAGEIVVLTKALLMCKYLSTIFPPKNIIFPDYTRDMISNHQRCVSNMNLGIRAAALVKNKKKQTKCCKCAILTLDAITSHITHRMHAIHEFAYMYVHFSLILLLSANQMFVREYINATNNNHVEYQFNTRNNNNERKYKQQQ